MTTKRKGSKNPKTVGRMDCTVDNSCPPTDEIVRGKGYMPPLYKKPITKAEEKFMKGVQIQLYTCMTQHTLPGGSCGGVTINKTSSTPVIRVLSRSPNNATVKSIQAGMTRNADGSTTLTMDAWKKFQKAVNTKRPDIFAGYPITRSGKTTPYIIGSCGKKNKKTPRNVGNAGSGIAGNSALVGNAHKKFFQDKTKLAKYGITNQAQFAAYVNSLPASTVSYYNTYASYKSNPANKMTQVAWNKDREKNITADWNTYKTKNPVK